MHLPWAIISALTSKYLTGPEFYAKNLISAPLCVLMLRKEYF